ncbi:nitrogenase iron-molybdenum cofactor biosynthesis protein NifN [Photobacterium sp. ZSDE20]|uniref:Nitrogenase iron-molybdenum cofactor biosynthesis protein NifN n=1 Tax=Photobacterium pectinilyticum TaxID=2906793 RepID=A0ABT1N1J2_9GAMM|nr:nitrogenase iron-molybdenum cofactor biosynthesis protein NifN [Photobacterium sp. ZSDE20]MCQ1058570.1 nitrogenase iron-molybdenum cofactor biosynthesis protein NifN [Photobacterium sp. ZSDE20]MDD1826309.1 nitrogenase iron-molybdenum cofactor biosynthesis protein NifN [Photobacterium sp. ZSDE20]
MIKHDNQPLVQQPLKTSAATGAALAAMGVANAIPLMHGSQGCGAFSKVYLIQHFREPMPIQNSAIDQVAAVMGGDDNLLEALALLCQKHQPDCIVVTTTGLTEMQGCDTVRVIQAFYRQYPQYRQTVVIPVATPDFVGTMQSGFSSVVDQLVRQLAPTEVDEEARLVRSPTQVTLLCSVSATSADIENAKRYIEAFGLDALVIPDISDSLDGHLAKGDYSATSTGGTAVASIRNIAASALTIVMGESLLPTAKWLQKRFDIPYLSWEMGMKSTDQLIGYLHTMTAHPVPAWIKRDRQRLEDAWLDSHFLLSGEQIAIALESDLAANYLALLNEIGAEVSLIITTGANEALKQAKRVIIGSLSELNHLDGRIKAVIGSTHAAQITEPAIPVLRAGYPCIDQLGNMDVAQWGYQGARSRLFALANLLLSHHSDEVELHHSDYRFDASEVSAS